VWSDLVGVAAPGLDLGLSVVEAEEPVVVQALIAELAVEALNVAVLDGFAGSDDVDLHAGLVGPGVQRLAGELRPVVADDELGSASGFEQASQNACHPRSAIDVSTSMARHSLVNSSTMFRVGKRRPLDSVSSVKSMDHRWLQRLGGGSTVRRPRAMRLRLLRRTASPSARYSRYKRLWLICHPPLRSSTWTRL